jgi:hypothetical protein
VPAVNTTFSSDCYVPILACRAAERAALTLIDDLRVAPLLVVRDPDVMATAIARAWLPHDGVLFVQSAAPVRSRPLGGAYSLAALFDRLRRRSVQAVPVVNASDAWNTDAVAGIVRRDRRGVLVRLAVHGMAQAASGSLQRLARVVDCVGCTPRDTDLLLDIRPQRTVASCADVAQHATDAVRAVGDWRNLIVRFPDRPGVLNAVAGSDPSARIVRDDLAAYEALLDGGVGSAMVFADSGVRLPRIDRDARAVDAQARMRIVNDVISASAGLGAPGRRRAPMYIGTSWTPAPDAVAAAHSLLTKALLHHMDGVLARLADIDRINVNRAAPTS